MRNEHHGKDAAQKGANRYAPKPKRCNPEGSPADPKRDAGGGAEACARTHTKNVAVRHRVFEYALQATARYGKASAHEIGKQRARQADLKEDHLRIGRTRNEVIQNLSNLKAGAAPGNCRKQRKNAERQQERD